MEMTERSSPPPGDRDSVHELSYNFTRFSVVDSMLSSLSDLPSTGTAQDSTIYGFPAPNDLYANAPKLPAASNTGRRRGHTQSSSMSEHERAHVDDLARSYTEYHAKGHKSIPHTVRPVMDKQTLSNSGMLVTDLGNHTRGSATRGSKSSGSSSVDLGYKSAALSSRPPPNRAASFDHSYSPPKGFKVRDDNDSPVPIDYTALDCAPTPTIPAGPRRPSEPLSPLMTLSAFPAKQKSGSSRRNSIKSAAGKSVRKAKSNAPMNQDVRSQAQQFVQYTSGTMNASPTAGSAPSPTVGTIRRTNPPSSAAPKEPRPGFFRRVFGSSRHDKSSHQEEVHRPPSPAAVRQMSVELGGSRPRTQPSQQPSNTQYKSSSRPPTQDPSTSGKYSRESQPPMTLRKAHSSFFRRRKKSMSDDAMPPVPPLNLQTQQALGQLSIAPAQRSPGGQSLRGAMAHFLADGAPAPQEMFYDSREQQSEASSPVIYSMPHAAVHEPEKAVSRQGAREERLVGIQDPMLTQTQNAENMKLRNGKPNITGNYEDGSFLVDSSSSEAMGNSSPTDPDLAALTKKQNQSMTSNPYHVPLHSKDAGNSPPRKANIGEKRAETLLPANCSENGLQRSESEPTAHLYRDEDDGVVISQRSRSGVRTATHTTRVWLDPSSSDEKLADSGSLKLPIEVLGAAQRPALGPVQVSPTSDSEAFISASSLPTLQVESQEVRMSKEWTRADGEKAIIPGELDITSMDRERARMIFDGDEEFVTKAGAAAWLGQTSPRSSRTRKAYMELFDWSGQNIVASFRELCAKLVVKAESQQLDRVIEAFSERWCTCNPNNGFKDRDVVHTITFSILMLNTDLHMADLDQRMTRAQFVKNTLPTIRNIADAAVLGGLDTARAKGRQARDFMPWDQQQQQTTTLTASSQLGGGGDGDEAREQGSLEVRRNRLSLRPQMRGDSSEDAGSTDNCNVLVKAPYEGSMKAWDFQVEIVLKEFYNSIRQQPLPLHGQSSAPSHPSTSHHAAGATGAQTTGGLSVMNGLRRTPSVLSKAPSENASYRGRSSETNRFATGRFGGSKTRSRPRVYPNSTIGSSRTSLDEQSVWSPAGSSWSKYSMGKTQTSMSVESFGSHLASQDYQKAIGFANALSQAIIREEGMGSQGAGPDEFGGRVVPLLNDTLELAGPPWAKEGIVKHKHHLESLEKKAKERNWIESFAVIEKGWIKLFSFSSKSKSMRQRAKSRNASAASSVIAAPVGGGNWTENAELMNEFLLRQTIASALPSPGYSKTRPHVFALSLPTGAVHLFQVGTAEIVKEFVSTANYWSARLSKPPLIGGVSNIEYGWGENVLNPSFLMQRPESTTPGQTPGTSSSNQSGSVRRSSITSAATSPGHQRVRSEDQASIAYKIRLPGDKVVISDWSPPTQSMMASQLMEVDQLKELSTYVGNVEEELKKHNELRSLMGMAFSPRHPNAAKAMANWEKKSAYLLREIVKFKTYVDSLKLAQQQKEVVDEERKARAAEKAALSPELQQEASNPNSSDNVLPVPALAATNTQQLPPKTAQSA